AAVASITAASPAATTTTSSGHLRGPQPVLEEGGTRSGHLYIPKPTPTLTARPPAPMTVNTTRINLHSTPTNKSTVSGAAPTPAPVPTPTKTPATGQVRKPVAVAGKQNPGASGDSNNGFVYPKATRKPVGGSKPAIAAKPKNLAAQSQSQSQSQSADPPGSDHTTYRPMDAASHREFDQRLRRLPQETVTAAAVSRGRSTSHDKGSLASTASMRAPQMIAVPPSSAEGAERRSVSPRGERITHVTRGFQAPREATLEEEPGEGAVKVDWERAAVSRQRGPTEGWRGAAGDGDHHRHGLQHNQHHGHEPQDRDHRSRHGHAPAEGSPQYENNASANRTVDDDQVTQETTHSEIRAQAIAAANSFRAKGANSGGYVVNTGKLRQVIKNNTDNSLGGGGGSGHLMQALADGAMSAASAAASGLGWGQQSSPLSSSPQAAQGRPTRPHQQQPHYQQSPPKSRHLDRAPGRNHHLQNPVEQAHDLTMKDIHFQTLAPGEYVVKQTVYDPLPQVLSSPPQVATTVTPTTMASAPTTQTTTIPVTYNQQNQREKDHQQQQQQQQPPRQSPPQPASRVMDTPSRIDPLPPIPIAVAIEAHPDNNHPITPTPTGIPPPRLDKTLPKIQEQPASQSRILNHKQQQGVEEAPSSETATRPSAVAMTGSVTAAIFNSSSNIIVPPAASSAFRPLAAQVKTAAQMERARYYYGRAAETSATSGATALAAASSAANGPSASAAGGVGGVKAINPKLQEYIQKYNLAANTRS
ncbi:hypothetical protein BGZ95_005995, partial [Linnemannia exigua]